MNNLNTFEEPKAAASKQSLLTDAQCAAIDELTKTGRMLDDATAEGAGPPIPAKVVGEQMEKVTRALEILEFAVFFTQCALGGSALIAGDLSRSVSFFASAVKSLVAIVRRKMQGNREYKG